MTFINLPKKKRTVKNDTRKKERQDIYNTQQWRDLRLIKLEQNPLCEECLLEGKVVVATEVHHKNSFMKYYDNQRIEKAFDIENLESLCRQCHQNKHKHNSEFKF